MSQAFGFSCKGGLNTNLNQFELLTTPGAATELKNFEVDSDGGYRRVNGYVAFGDSRPNSTNRILGLAVYGDGLIACSGTNIYFTLDGDTWLQINRASVDSGGDNYSTFTGRSVDERTSQGQCSISIFEGSTTYGEVFICDGANKPFYFKMTGSGGLSSRTYFAKEVTVSSTVAPTVGVIHDKHFVVGGASTTANTIYYSGTLDPDDFTSTGSGTIQLEDQVVGLKSFRNDLYIFCTNSIFKLSNINNSSTIVVTPVAKNVGCLSHYSIQEVGGDLVFLAPDGIRSVAGTARIGDVELGSVSRQIQSVISDIAASINSFNISSCILRTKAQYRLFYSTAGASTATSKGIIGTLTQTGFQWSETLGIQAPALTSGFNSDGIEKIYHGDNNGYVYTHDSGNAFYSAGTALDIEAKYKTPNFDFGDAGTRKTLKYVKISMTPEGSIEPSLRVRYDYEDTDIPQPTQVAIENILLPSIFGSGIFGTSQFGGSSDPMIRQTVTGSGHAANLRIYSKDQKAAYSINGMYIDYVPSGRR